MGYFVGAISGTSIDGLDLALIKVRTDSIIIETAITVPFPENLRASLLKLATVSSTDIVRLGRTHTELGTFIGEQVAQFISISGYSSADIVAIGSHGQTIRHAPDGMFSFSFQIGDASRIAEITEIDTIADFRAADIAAGGQGAPLVPVLHDRLFRSNHVDRVIVNVGGISNVTFLPTKQTQTILGFDTGPGNALLDAWMQHHFDLRYDNHGELASSGSIIEQLLERLLSDPWLAIEPPKSTGTDHFNLHYVQEKVKSTESNPSPSDILATLTEFTAITLSRAITQWCSENGEIIVCGGGRLNKCLMGRLAHQLPNHVVQTCGALGIDGDAVEAATFGYLAYLFVNKQMGNIPAVTGANRARILGCLYPA